MKATNTMQQENLVRFFDWHFGGLEENHQIKPHSAGQLATQVLGTVLVLKERHLYTPQMSGIPLEILVTNQSTVRNGGSKPWPYTRSKVVSPQNQAKCLHTRGEAKMGRYSTETTRPRLLNISLCS